MQLKQYQKQSLEALEQFFSVASAIGAERAFECTLQQQAMTPVPYNDRLGGIPSVCIRIPTGGGKTCSVATAYLLPLGNMPILTRRLCFGLCRRI